MRTLRRIATELADIRAEYKAGRDMLADSNRIGRYDSLVRSLVAHETDTRILSANPPQCTACDSRGHIESPNGSYRVVCTACNRLDGP